MKENLQKDDNEFENLQIIYCLCLKEIIRQVSINCNERGNFLERILCEYLELIDKFIHSAKESINEKDEFVKKEIDQSQFEFNKEINKLKTEIIDLEKDVIQKRNSILKVINQNKALKEHFLSAIKLVNKELNNSFEEIDNLKIKNKKLMKELNKKIEINHEELDDDNSSINDFRENSTRKSEILEKTIDVENIQKANNSLVGHLLKKKYSLLKNSVNTDQVNVKNSQK